MRKISLLALAIIFSSICLSSCQKFDGKHSDHPFSMEINKLRSTGVCVDIIPENNDFHYMFTVIPKEYADAFKGKEEELIKSLDQTLKDIYIIITEDENLSQFKQKALYDGAYFEYYHDLTPDTEYAVIAYAYTGINPDSTLTRIDFITPESVKSDITFGIQMDGSVLKVTPSNSDAYFYTAYRKEFVDEDYDNAFDFHLAVDEYYWEEGFFPDILDSGNSEYDLIDFYQEINVGDKFYVTASGYKDGINSKVYAYLVTFNGSEVPGTVTELHEED